jgi:upstream activation factor subunit UAF30
MPKQSKSTKTEVAETSAVNTPVEQVEKVAKTKNVKPKAVKADATPKVDAAPKVNDVVPVSEAVAGDAPVSTEAVADVDADLAAQTTEFLAKLNQASALFASLKSEFRTLEKKWSRALKTAEKSQAKRKRKSGNRQPSGFVKPTKISDELAKFLEKPIGSEMARTDVTREINKYIRSHNLQDKENGRKINPDPKLQTLLKLKKTDELTYFNLQRYMSPHFSKAEKPAPSASA